MAQAAEYTGEEYGVNMAFLSELVATPFDEEMNDEGMDANQDLMNFVSTLNFDSLKGTRSQIFHILLAALHVSTNTSSGTTIAVLKTLQMHAQAIAELQADVKVNCLVFFVTYVF